MKPVETVEKVEAGEKFDIFFKMDNHKQNYNSITATTPQRPLSSVPEVVVVERFDCSDFQKALMQLHVNKIKLNPSKPSSVKPVFQKPMPCKQVCIFVTTFT